MDLSNKKSTIHDIARELGLNSSTVSRALKDHPRISAATKALVLAKAEELNYRPNQMASNLRTGRSNTIGLIVPRINRSFFANVIFGVEQVCSEAGFNLLICQSIEKLDKEIADLNTLRNSRVDGVLLSLSVESEDTDYLAHFLESRTPVVLFDRAKDSLGVHTVIHNNEQVSYEVTKHLLSQGYRRIVHFGGPRYLDSYLHRYQGYRRAMLEAGLVPQDEEFPQVLTFEAGYQRTMALFSGPDRPDAIFSTSDYSAHGALEALKALGLRVPEDVGITGFANEPFTELLQPTVTSVELFPIEMGKQSAELLLRLISGEATENPVSSISIDPRIFFRQSSDRRG